MRMKMLFCVLATAFRCFAAGTAAGAERFHDVGFRADLESLGAGREERLDLYYPKDPAPGERFPGVVIIHGGGWAGGDKGNSREINIGSNLAVSRCSSKVKSWRSLPPPAIDPIANRTRILLDIHRVPSRYSPQFRSSKFCSRSRQDFLPTGRQVARIGQEAKLWRVRLPIDRQIRNY